MNRHDPLPGVIHPEDTLEDALAIMVSRDFNHLPVVERGSPDTLAGFLTRTDIMKSYCHEISNKEAVLHG